MPQLLFDDFAELPLGPLPTDFTAVGEYHFAPPEGEMGQWYEPIRSHQWRCAAPWLVLEDDSRHRLLQTIPAGKQWPRILVTGDPDWRDYTITAKIQPLKPDGFVGICFRYRSGRSYYAFGFDGVDTVKLIAMDHEDKVTLSQRHIAYSCEQVHELSVTAAGRRITACVDGQELMAVEDDRFVRGRVGLLARTTCIYDSIEATDSNEIDAAFVQTRDRRERELDALRERHPTPELWRQIGTKGFGTGRHLRFGHLQGHDSLDVLVAQNIKLRPGSDALTTVRCLTALDLDGNLLWQFGEPSNDLDAAMVTCDLPVQVYDIDGDGVDEALCLKNSKLYILDGRTGDVKNVTPLPLSPNEENDLGRLIGDAIIIANFRGLGRPSDIVVKNRYRQVWAMDSDLNVMWTREFPTWQCGHFAQPYDFDGDGRDELFIGYCLLGPDGETRWQHDWPDHTDEIAIGPFDPGRDDVQIALAAGSAGFNILGADGTVLHRDYVGHAQRLSAARFRADLPGCQFYVVTYWGEAGILSFHDCQGRKLFEFEPTALGSVLNPVNWTGNGEELALLSGSKDHGGMVDGQGRRVVLFPDDGHPQLCAEALDLAGDARDEIVLWDADRIWIYTQNAPFEGQAPYQPHRYPHYNASNYRAEISLPHSESSPLAI